MRFKMVQDDLIHLEPQFFAWLTGFRGIGSRYTVTFNFLLTGCKIKKNFLILHALNIIKIYSGTGTGAFLSPKFRMVDRFSAVQDDF